MLPITVQFLGSGDAFGSGGRFQTCISVRTEGAHVLLDCGASSLVAMKRLNVDTASVDAVLVTHLHGDHFGGIPFLILDAQFSRRERPLLVVGPPGLQNRVMQAMEVFFPGSSRSERRFELRFAELLPRTEAQVGAFSVMAYEVVHASGAPSYALRLSCADRVIAYSGDTEWTDVLLEVARGADLFICEAYFFEKAIKGHLAYATLQQHHTRLGCRRLVLTHMSANMLEHCQDVSEEVADDGVSLTVG